MYEENCISKKIFSVFLFICNAQFSGHMFCAEFAAQQKQRVLWSQLCLRTDIQQCEESALCTYISQKSGPFRTAILRGKDMNLYRDSQTKAASYFTAVNKITSSLTICFKLYPF